MIRSSCAAPALLLLALAACHDQPAAPPPETPTERTLLAELRCRVEPAAGTMVCGQAPGPTGPSFTRITVGGQHHFVRLANTGSSFNEVSGLFSTTVTVQNLLQQPMATADGTTAHSDGVRVFFSQGPEAPVTVENESGTTTFTGPDQAYFQYGTELGANGILTKGETSAGKVWQFRTNGAAGFSFTVYVTAEVPSVAGAYFSLTSVAASSAGSHTCGLTAGGQAWCWGAHAEGQLGHGDPDPHILPVTVAQGATTFASIHTGAQYSCGLTAGGQAWCWGINLQGQLGDGTTDPHGVPNEVTQPDAFVALATGNEHACGLTDEGQAWCWGDNDFGQIGDSTVAASRLLPVAVKQPAGVAFVTLSAGYWHTCATTEDGQAYCWGWNDHGQLGDSTITQRTRPVPVKHPTAVTFASVYAGRYHTCGLTADGEAYCWGEGTDGLIGDQNIVDRWMPTAVSGGLNFASLSAAHDHTCGRTAAGRAYCWGNNGNGRLGDGTQVVRAMPEPVAQPAGTNFTVVASGFGHNCAVTSGGPMYCWGLNAHRQVGDGTSESRLVPVFVAGTQ